MLPAYRRQTAAIAPGFPLQTAHEPMRRRRTEEAKGQAYLLYTSQVVPTGEASLDTARHTGLLQRMPGADVRPDLASGLLAVPGDGAAR